MEKLREEKVFRDPIHGYIRVSDKVVWDCIITKEFQRLRRIRQLGSTSFVYHAGEHTRFAHSLGVYEIVRRMVNEVDDLNKTLTEYEKITVMLAGLLHDIGHAPFSHSFEAIMKKNHEEYTVQIILGPSEINDVLNKYHKNLAQDVASIIKGNHPKQILCQLVSSQLDADRMDYLLRDSYFTGTKYGEFDLERILRTLRVKEDKLVVKESGIHTIEDYIMARYHMYWQVYYHPVSRSFDGLLVLLFKRLFELYKKDNKIVERLPMFKALLEKEVLDNHDLYLLDDSCCWYSFNIMSEIEDPILADLASRALKRNLFKYDDIEKYDSLVTYYQKNNINGEYYLYRDYQNQSPYHPYTKKASHSIWIIKDDDTINELSDVSNIVSAISQTTQNDQKVFYPKEIVND